MIPDGFEIDTPHDATAREQTSNIDSKIPWKQAEDSQGLGGAARRFSLTAHNSPCYPMMTHKVRRSQKG
jgi:hypothetical protein